MSCEDCELTLPCYAGKLTMAPGGGKVARVHACPYCARIFIVNYFEDWWDYIRCEMREGVIKRERLRMQAGYAFSHSLRDYNAPKDKLNQMLCNLAVDDPGPGTLMKLWACPKCANPVLGKGVPRYIGIRRRWLAAARSIETGKHA